MDCLLDCWNSGLYRRSSIVSIVRNNIRADCAAYKPWRFSNTKPAAIPHMRGMLKEFGMRLAAAMRGTKGEPITDDAWIPVANLAMDETAHAAFMRAAVPEIMGRADAVSRALDLGWNRPKALASIVLANKTLGRAFHALHQSTEDPTKVAYYPTMRHFMEAREVRTTYGRYLTKYYGGCFSEAEIRAMANAYLAEARPPALNFVANTDPDGWEWVYEHGHEFTSCMTYARIDRYLDARCCGLNHPVRAYAYPGNGLKLAWLGNPDDYMKPDGRVFARAIVRDGDSGETGYIRAYGDDRLIHALENAGYGDRVSLSGVRLHRREINGDVICPYLDDGLVNDCGPYLLVSDDGVETDSTGLLGTDQLVCENCGERHHEEDGIWVGRNEDTWVGPCCKDNYTWVVGRRYDRYYVYEDRAVWVGGIAYDVNYLDDNNIAACAYCGDHSHTNDIYATPSGRRCGNCCTALDVEYDGYTHAPDSDVATTYDGRVIHVGAAITVSWGDGEEYVLHRDDAPEDYLPEVEDDEDTDVPSPVQPEEQVSSSTWV